MSSEPFGAAYADARVLVTGDTGFVGSWAVRWLHRLGAEVIGYSRGRSEAPVPPPRAVVHRSGYIEDSNRLRAVFHEYPPDLVLHLAGETLVSRGFQAPAATLRSNLLGCISVLDAALHCDRTLGVVLAGTPASASATTGPVGPYAASKQAVEAVAAGFAHPMTQRPVRDRELQVVVARPGVMVGGDWADGRLVPDVVRAVRAGAQVSLRHPDAVRPWQHVLDGLSGMLTVGWRILRGGVPRLSYDFGRPDPASAEPAHRLVAALLAELGRASWPVEYGTGDSPDRLLLGCATASDELGWVPTWDLSATTAATAQWYRRLWQAPGSSGSITDEQIESFVGCAKSGRPGWAVGAGVTSHPSR